MATISGFSSSHLSQFSKIKDFSFKDQVQRAGVSVSNNIAEGFDRGNKKDFVRFLNISISSASEVKSMLYLADRLKLINEETALYLIQECVEVSKIIMGLKRSTVKLIVEPKNQLTK